MAGKKRRKELTLNAVAMGNLRRRGKQNAILMLGVALAVFFLSAALFGMSSLMASLEEQAARDYGVADELVWNAPQRLREQIDEERIFEQTAQMELLYVSEEIGRNENEAFVAARYDERADELMRYQLLEGRFPHEEGEIAMESSLLLRMRSKAGIGDTITLKLRCFDGEQAMAQEIEKSFVLVGLLDKKGDERYGQWYNYWRDHAVERFWIAPEVLVSAQEPLEPGAREAELLIGRYGRDEEAAAEKLGLLVEEHEKAFGKTFFCSRIWNNSIWHTLFVDGAGEDSALALGFIAVFGALTMAAMAGIANAMTSNIDRRKGQIGMLRAIGATQTQIRRILLRETLGVMLCTLPAGVALALGALGLLVRLGTGWLVWHVPLWMIAADAAACALCITLATLVPLHRSARITPMQAVRDIDLTRMFLRKGERSSRRFVPHRLIARRSMGLRRGRTAGLTALLAAGGVLFSIAAAFGANMWDIVVVPEDPDITLREPSRYYEDKPWEYGGFLNEDRSGNRFLYSDLYEIEELPGVTRTETRTQQTALIMVDEISDYITVGHFGSMASYAFEELYGFDRMLWLKRGLTPEEAYAQKAESFGMAQAYADYQAMKQRFGIEGEAIEVPLVGLTRAKIEELEEYVYAGSLNVEKILSGEEVLLIAPRSVQIAYEVDESGSGGTCTLYDGETIFPGEELIGGGYARERKETYTFTELFENDMFRAGGVLEYEWWRSEGVCTYDEEDVRTWPEDVERVRRSVKIGALLTHEANSGYGAQVVILTGREQLGDAGISEAEIWLDDDLDEETRGPVAAQIERIGMRSNRSFTDYGEIVEDRKKDATVFLIVFIVVGGLLFAFTWAMLSNAVSGRIRADVRQIGTLRAVGADRREVFRAYVWQFYRVFFVGLLIAWPVTAALNFLLFGQFQTWSAYLNGDARLILITPVYFAPMLLLCLAGVRGKLRPIFRDSVVNNIRVL
ncbi:MAG: ABC transporter permease [Eubacteriales bacterium]|nr:ABC transporter permease [Eubacteriales bacterium]